MYDVNARIHLVDDDEQIRRAMSRVLTAAGYVVQVHHSAEAFLEIYNPDEPGCVIVDLRLPGMDGFGIQDALGSSEHANKPLIFLSGGGDIPTSVRAMKAGALDFLTKPVASDTLLAAVGQALAKDLQLRANTRQRKAVELRLASLTPREREVLSHVVAGRLNKQIAGDLGIVEKTIKVHRGRMMAKMGVRTVADLVRDVSLANMPH